MTARGPILKRKGAVEVVWSRHPNPPNTVRIEGLPVFRFGTSILIGHARNPKIGTRIQCDGQIVQVLAVRTATVNPSFRYALASLPTGKKR